MALKRVLGICCLLAIIRESLVSGAPSHLQMRGHPNLEPRSNGTANIDAYVQEANAFAAKWANNTINPRVPKNASDNKVVARSGSKVLHGPTREKALKQRRKSWDGPSHLYLEYDPEAQSMDRQYMGEVYFQSQRIAPFMTRFDTTSSDFIVPGRTCFEQQGCVGNNKYQEAGLPEPNSHQGLYVGSEIRCMGDLFLDEVSIGGVTAPDVHVFSITNANNLPVYQGNSHASLGLAFHNLRGTTGRPSWFEVARSREGLLNGLGRSPEISFYHGRQESGTSRLSQLTIGGRDETLFHGDTHDLALVNRGYWQVAVEGAIVATGGINRQFIVNPITRDSAIIDTSRSYIGMPTIVADMVFAAIPGAFPMVHMSHTYRVPSSIPGGTGRQIQPSALRSYAFPCNLPPRISLIMGEDREGFAIDERDLNLGQLPGNNPFVDLPGAHYLENAEASGLAFCLASIVGQDRPLGTPKYILGTSFLKGWYMTLNIDESTVRLAQAIDSAPEDGGGSGSDPPPSSSPSTQGNTTSEDSQSTVQTS